MAIFQITEVCTYCWGTGKNPTFVPEGTGQVDCPKCTGTGRAIHGRFDDGGALSDILDKCNDILDKCNDILQEVQS